MLNNTTKGGSIGPLLQMFPMVYGDKFNYQLTLCKKPDGSPVSYSVSIFEHEYCTLVSSFSNFKLEVLMEKLKTDYGINDKQNNDTITPITDVEDGLKFIIKKLDTLIYLVNKLLLMSRKSDILYLSESISGVFTMLTHARDEALQVAEFEKELREEN